MTLEETNKRTWEILNKIIEENLILRFVKFVENYFMLCGHGTY